MNISNFDVDFDLFTGKKVGDILILSFKEKPLLHVTDLNVKKELFDYLDAIDCCDEIKVLLIRESPSKMNRKEYIAFYENIIDPEFDRMSLERMYYAVSQFIVKLADLNKMVIHADCGNVILLFMNISLACNYRIVADDTVYQNPDIELGVVPKGGSVFFLSKMLGTVTASRILLSGEDLTAVQAQELGIVDKVVSLKDLDRISLETAQRYASLPSGYSIGIKKLLNFDLKELVHYLEFENQLIQRQIRSCHLHNFGRLNENL